MVERWNQALYRSLDVNRPIGAVHEPSLKLDEFRKISWSKVRVAPLNIILLVTCDVVDFRI